jgi:transcriptional regulator with XRE-family HTH domain
MRRQQAGPTPEALGDALRAVIKAANKTQEDVARAAGIPTRTFARYLAGDSAMPASALLATATGLGVSPGELADAVMAAVGRTDGRTDGPTDRPTDRPTDHSQRNRRHRQSEGQLALSARTGEPLRETITHSEGTDVGPRSQTEYDTQRDADIRAALQANRVKNRRRSG